VVNNDKNIKELPEKAIIGEHNIPEGIKPLF
jgi:hypothetical protein